MTRSSRPVERHRARASGPVRLAPAALAVVLALAGCTGSPAPTPSDTASPTVPTQPEVVYFPRESETGLRLGRELREVPQDDPLKGVVEAMIEGPVDPDYFSGWQAGTEVLSATTTRSVTTVDLSGEAREASLGQEAALARVEQLVWTVTELVGPDTSVLLTIDGRPAGDLWGVTTWDEPKEREDAYSVRVLVSIDSPLDGATVTSPVTITGDGALYEGTLPWRILDPNGNVVQEGVANSAEGMTFSEYSFEVDLAPGDYTVEVREEDASDGEGWAPDSDTRRITVTG